MTLDVRGPLLTRPPRRRSRRAPVAIAALLIAVVVTAVVTIVQRSADSADPSRSGGSLPGVATARATAFLRDWVDPDGRVVRRDQGNDTVSEGQAYGMLLALALNDRRRFDAIWTWTRSHLQRADGSLAWLWRDGAVRDTEPAADADVDTATALVQAGDRWHDPALHRAGARISAVTLTSSTVSARGDSRVLAGGPWAVGGAAASVDPDYVVSGTAERLAAGTGQVGWRQVAAGTRELQRTLLRSSALPPDWVRLSNDSATPTPIGAPGTGGAPQYGVSAPRLFVRLAASCHPADRALAARAGGPAADPDAVAVRNLDGSDRVSWRNAITAIGAAGVEAARGDAAATRRDLDTAAAQEHRAPTYYGSAWVALGSVLLTSRQLDSCGTEGADA